MKILRKVGFIWEWFITQENKSRAEDGVLEHNSGEEGEDFNKKEEEENEEVVES